MKSFITLTTAGASLFLAAIAVPAQAFTVAPSTLSDTEFNSLILNGEFDELFVAESRAGDEGTNRTYEQSINKALVPNGNGGLTFPGTFTQTNKTWESGQTVSFSLSYDAITGETTYTVDGDVLSAVINDFDPNGIFLRTRAQGRDSNSDAALTLQNLMLDDGSGFQAIPGLSSTSVAGSKDVDYLVISGLNASFTLKGEETLAWNGRYPKDSRLATQIKVGAGSYTAAETEPVPEPLTILGTVAALGFGYGMKRRRQDADV